jgi:L-amino acid N-acyltransferase YncA
VVTDHLSRRVWHAAAVSSAPVPGIIRAATPADAQGCLDIYAPYVRETAISFEAEPPTVEEMARRITEAQRAHAWLVLEDGGQVAGYAYGGSFMARAAYRYACSVSVYLAQDRRRTGAGRALYEALLTRLTERGFRVAMAGIALPNPASEGLHRALGFDPVGTYRRVGWKFDAWHDVAWCQRPLGNEDGPPSALR